MSSTETVKEGELYKRLHDSQYVEDSSIVSSYEMEKLFNEARADLVSIINSGKPVTLIEYSSEIVAFFEKWFGASL